MNAFRVSSRVQVVYSIRRIVQYRSLCAQVAPRFLSLSSTQQSEANGPASNDSLKESIEKTALHTCASTLRKNSFQKMNSDSLTILSTLEVEEACAELLKRNIMSEDGVEYSEADKILDEIAKYNREGMGLEKIPYVVGVAVSCGAGVISLPLCFHEGIVTWFNDQCVTGDVPEPKDLESVLEIGAWAWNWMEPPLGAISFLLLCLQFARGQIQNLGLKPYTQRMRQRRALKLVRRFPQYDSYLLMQYSLATRYFK